MKVLGVALLLCVGVLPALGQVAPECTHTREHFNFFSFVYGYYIWISAPPLLNNDTSFTVYFCSSWLFFTYGETGSMRAAIREANTADTWNYTESLISCEYDECWDLYQNNFSNYLVTSHMFTSLNTNTLYSLEFLGCYEYQGSCIVGNSRFKYSVNITTRPAAPQFHWLTTAKAIQIYFQADYFTGPTPDGHEVLVWPKTVASPSTASALSHYFPLSTLNATVEGLLPSTEYFLYVRVNGTHFANNQGSWVRREAKTRAPDPPIPQLIQFAMRDTAVLLKLHPSLLASGVVSCLVELVSPASGLNTTSFLNHTMSDLDGGLCLFIEGLVPNQEYSLRLAAINEAGVSGFTEWVNFTTTSAVVHSTPFDAAGSLTLQWTLPSLFDGDSLLQYEVTLTPLRAGSAVQVRYTLPATQSELTAQGLQEGVEYQVMIETRVDSGLVQPFYSMNITIPVAPSSSAAVVNGVAGAGVTLLIVLVCGAAVGVLLLVVFLKWRKGGNKQTRKERSSSQRNVSDMCDEVTMKANPAYGAVEFDVGEGADPQRYEARYHSQEDVIDQLRDKGGCEEGEGLRDGAGLGCDEPRVEKADHALYENITR